MSRDFADYKSVPNSAAEPLGRPSVDFVRARERTSEKKPLRSVLNWWKRVWSLPAQQGRFLGWPATLFILTQVLAGIPLVPYALLHWHTDNSLRYASFLAVALGASLFKVRLPGIQATMSANFLFILVGILDLSYPETLLMGCLGGLVQSLCQAKPRPHVIQ